MDAVKYLHQQILEAGPSYVQDWPLVRDPLPCLWLTVAYLLVVRYIGPWFMRDREPFDLRIPIIIHNVTLILVNAWIFYMGGIMGWFEYEKYTQCFVYGHRDLFWEAFPTYVYYISKYVDWLDTVFLILRKKGSHVTTLHVYHHASMPIATWLFFKLAPGGHTTFGGFFNTIVHMIMYTYYLLASLGPHMRPYLGWKKYLTQLQIIQFLSGFLHSVQFLFKPCTHPMILTYILLVNSVILLSLFTNFYFQAYIKNRSRKKTT